MAYGNYGGMRYRRRTYRRYNRRTSYARGYPSTYRRSYSRAVKPRRYTNYRALARRPYKRAAPAVKVENPAPAIKLGKCTEDYALQLLSPFKYSGACMPTWPSFETGRYHILERFTVVAGTLGVGFCMLDDGCGVNDGDTVLFTTALYTGLVFTDNKATTGVDAVESNDAPIATADLDANTRIRRVAAGLKIRYMGRDDATSGRYIGLMKPFASPMTGLNAATTLAFDQAHTDAIGKDWYQVNWLPQDPSDALFTTNLAGVTSVTPHIGIMVDGAVAGAVFECEVVVHFEIVGHDSSSGHPSTPDQKGMDMAMDAAALAQSSGTQNNVSNATKAEVLNYVVQMGAKDQTFGDVARGAAMAGIRGAGTYVANQYFKPNAKRRRN